MKPDQHKKKRSAQYKKKHGIQDKGKDSKKKDEKTSTSKSSQVRHEESAKEDTGTGKDVKAGSARRLSGSSDTSSDGEETAASGTFSRRKVLSNWDRYEAPLPRYEDSSDVALRGADFRSLLASSGEAEAQFRFEDEKDWEADDAGETQPQLSVGGVLSLNCDLLAESLQAIPLHRRLNIHPESLTDDIVESFNAEAAIHASCEQQTLPQTPLKPKLSITEATASSVLDNLLRRVEQKPLQLNLNVSLNPKQQTKSVDILKFDFTVPTAVSVEMPVTSEGSIDPKTEQDLQESAVAGDETVDRTMEGKSGAMAQDELDDELDVLLSLDSATQPDTTADREADILVNNVEEVKLPIEEKLAESKASTVMSTQQQDVVPQPVEETVDLEDWLDSVLDD